MSSQTREIVHDQHTHPTHSTRTYWLIAGVLTVLTVGEIGLFYLENTLGGLAPPLILVLSAAKFILVVMFYMHLKYDSRVFSGVFLFPFALGSLVVVGLFLLYHILPTAYVVPFVVG